MITHPIDTGTTVQARVRKCRCIVRRYKVIVATIKHSYTDPRTKKWMYLLSTKDQIPQDQIDQILK